MNRIIGVLILIGAIVCISLSPQPSKGFGCKRVKVFRNNVAVQKVVVQKQVVVAQEVVPVAVPVAYPAIAVPVYSYVNAPGYVPGVSQVHGQSQADIIADLVIKKLEAKFGQGVLGGGGPPKAVGTNGYVQQAVVLLQNRCASCHSDNAKAGGGHSFFTGGTLKDNLSLTTYVDMYNAVYEKRMPKGQATLSDQEVALIRILMKHASKVATSK